MRKAKNDTPAGPGHHSLNREKLRGLVDRMRTSNRKRPSCPRISVRSMPRRKPLALIRKRCGKSSGYGSKTARSWMSGGA
jgi:hypothetical protein